MPGIGSIEWESDEERARHRHRRKASTVHGWVTKMRGTLLGSEATRQRGLREMKEARAIRRAKQEHPEAFRTRNRSGGTVLWIFPRRSRRQAHHDHPHYSHSHGHVPSHAHSHSHSHAHSHSHSHSRSHSRRHHHHHGDSHYDSHRPRYDDRYRERYSRRHPFLHFHHRVKSHHHGLGTFLLGCLLGRRDLREKGRYLMRLAAKERRKERHKRSRQRRDEAHAMRLERAVHGSPWWHR
ncbi:hypothetical protein C8Q77DRAFT_401060 [Trametes polyzona]|nr:hypothetical protein C8Q77DRAFT_401060 [Trametes polyzona]